jgi:Cys-tRNA(Pro)/Cys-tRNA(Cys) deacylase
MKSKRYTEEQIIRILRELDLKAAAKAAGVKKVRMASQSDAERWTGLEKGGISALALVNKGFQVMLDASARDFEQIAMSAGERGVQVVLAPGDFVSLTRAKVAAVAKASNLIERTQRGDVVVKGEGLTDYSVRSGHPM